MGAHHIGLADDHPMICEYVRSLLAHPQGLQVTGDAADISQLFTQTRRCGMATRLARCSGVLVIIAACTGSIMLAASALMSLVASVLVRVRYTYPSVLTKGGRFLHGNSDAVDQFQGTGRN